MEKAYLFWAGICPESNSRALQERPARAEDGDAAGIHRKPEDNLLHLNTSFNKLQCDEAS